MLLNCSIKLAVINNLKNQQKMNCPNCSKVLSCSCKTRVAKNGKKCCTSCVAKVNQTLGSTK
jgi:hypothetical protein